MSLIVCLPIIVKQTMKTNAYSLYLNVKLAFEQTNLYFRDPWMTNLRTDEMVILNELTKIGTDENKAIYSNSSICRCISIIFHRNVPWT